MLQTQRPFSDNITHYYVDDEVVEFLKSKRALQGIYNLMADAEGRAVVYPLVIPTSDQDYDFDLMMIIKHHKATDQGQWEIYTSDNFVKANTNLASLFSYIEKTTNTEANKLLDGIQRELKGYREKFNLPGKTFIELDGVNKIVAFGFSEEE